MGSPRADPHRVALQSEVTRSSESAVLALVGQIRRLTPSRRQTNAVPGLLTVAQTLSDLILTVAETWNRER